MECFNSFNLISNAYSRLKSDLSRGRKMPQSNQALHLRSIKNANCSPSSFSSEAEARKRVTFFHQPLQKSGLVIAENCHNRQYHLCTIYLHNISAQYMSAQYEECLKRPPFKTFSSMQDGVLMQALNYPTGSKLIFNRTYSSISCSSAIAGLNHRSRSRLPPNRAIVYN